MSGILTRRRSGLLGLAALIALLATLTAPAPPASAEPEVGDVNMNYAYCVRGWRVPLHLTFLYTDGPRVSLDAPQPQQYNLRATVLAPDGDNDGELDKKELGICNRYEPSALWSITPNGTTEPDLELVPLELILTIEGDSDGVVSAGVELPITAELFGTPNFGVYNEPRFQWVTVSSDQITIEKFGRGTQMKNRDQRPRREWRAPESPIYPFYDAAIPPEWPLNLNLKRIDEATLIIPSTVPPGEYTITARLFAADDTYLDAEMTITVGDPGANASSAELALGFEPFTYSHTFTYRGTKYPNFTKIVDLGPGNYESANFYDNPLTTADETTPETGIAPAIDGDIWVELSVDNSLGNIANDSGLSSVSFIGAGGLFTVHGSQENGVPERQPLTVDTGNGATPLTGVDSVMVTNADDVGATMFVKVEKADRKPGQVHMYALVIGDDGSPRTETITLIFTGPPASIDLGESASALRSVNEINDDDETVKDSIKFQLTAADEGGNDVEPPTSGYALRITGPDDKPVSSTQISRTQPAKGDDGKYYVTIANESGTDATPLAPGAYTLTAKKGDLVDEVGFAVAGPSAAIALSSESDSESRALEILKVTATVSDGEGNPVSDGTPVTIDSADTTILTPVGVEATVTKDGEATTDFAVVGAGRTIVTGQSRGVVDVLIFDNSGGDPNLAGGGVQTSWENGDPCLSRYYGYAFYRCEADSSAAELFSKVVSRGSTAIHVWNGDNWVRYSVVDGEMIPGSSDFTVIENDFLYISY